MGRRGWLLWALALLTVPVPYGGIGRGLAPVAWLAVVAFVSGVVGLVEDASLPWMVAGMLGLQAAGAAVVLALVVGPARRVVERMMPAGQEPWVTIVAGLALVVVALRPVYTSGLANTEGWTSLTGLWRLHAFVPEPPEPGPVMHVSPDGVLPREACAEHNPLRNPYFGDLHVHTRLSLDASTQGTRNRPRDAYRFARGEAVGIQPYDDAGQATRRLRLERPLDFAAVTDHAELFGEGRICDTPGLPGHASVSCTLYRRWPRLAFYFMNARASSVSAPVRHPFCGPRDVYCLEAALTPWREVQEAAEEAYDRTPACTFTTFVGYEWTGTPGSRNLHRNVIFRSRVVPDRPISHYDAPTPTILWRQLGKHCLDSLPGCDALAIPHNSNLSGNTMFLPPDGQTMTPEHATAWARAEPIIEIMQHKGDSECGAGAVDEECGFEKLPYDRFAGKYSRWLAQPPADTSFVRYALGHGLALEERLGVNPFHFGFVASTDTHLGTPGAVAEPDYVGHGGAGIPTLTHVPRGFPDDVEFNPGGLAVLWAEENSRGALFDALRRRETYGTSGPRMTVRFFGAWDFGEVMCGSDAFAARGYERGVPMGGTLPGRAADAPSAPTFAVWAVRDPGTARRPSTSLERVQIVKGWLQDGEPRERVFEIAGRATFPTEVDPVSCVPPGDGFESLCESWTDPNFDATSPAYYYARVLERPSCRWTTWVCNEHGVRCDDPGTIVAGLGACCDGSIPTLVRERAWTSPIWYRPADPDELAVPGEPAPDADAP